MMRYVRNMILTGIKCRTPNFRKVYLPNFISVERVRRQMLSAFLCFAILPNNSYAQISEPINLPPDGQRPIYDNICAHPYISVDTFKLYNDLNGKEFYILFDKEPEYAYSTSGYFNNNYNTTTITNKKYRGIDFSDYKRREAEGKIVTFSKILKYSFYEYLHFHDGKSNIYIIPQYAFQREAALPLMYRETFDREREFSTGKEIFAPGRWNLNVWRINKKSYTHKKNNFKRNNRRTRY